MPATSKLDLVDGSEYRKFLLLRCSDGDAAAPWCLTRFYLLFCAVLCGVARQSNSFRKVASAQKMWCKWAFFHWRIFGRSGCLVFVVLFAHLSLRAATDKNSGVFYNHVENAIASGGTLSTLLNGASSMSSTSFNGPWIEVTYCTEA